MDHERRERLLRTYQLLQEDSSEQHPLSTTTIIRLLKERWDQDAYRITVLRDVEALVAAGYDVRTVRSRQNLYYLAQGPELPAIPALSAKGGNAVSMGKTSQLNDPAAPAEDGKLAGQILSADDIRFLCTVCENDPERIGRYVLDLLPELTTTKSRAFLRKKKDLLPPVAEEIVERIPSMLLRMKYKRKLPDLSVMQWASIAHMILQGQELIDVFCKLASATADDGELKLLIVAVRDLTEFGYTDKRSRDAYNEIHPADEFPLFPFLERCYLPVLLKEGEIVRVSDGKKTVKALVAKTPENLPAMSDFSDESYLCYDLDCDDPSNLFEAHMHIHVLTAERGKEETLTQKQKENLAAIRKGLETVTRREAVTE